MESNFINLESNIKLLVLGRIGHGKSTFINKLLGKNEAETGGIEKSEGVTKMIQGYTGKILNSGAEILVYDTPGFGDEDVSMFDLMDQIEKEFCGKSIDFVIYVQRGDDHRIEKDSIISLKFCQEFIENKKLLHQKFIIVLTHCDKIENKCQISEEFLKQSRERLEWNINKIVCFSEHSSEKDLTNFLDYIQVKSMPLIIKKEAPEKEISALLKKELGDRKNFYGNNIIPQNLEIVPNKEKTKFNAVFLGKSSVGKTSIIHRLVNDTFSEYIVPTIGYDFKTLKCGEIDIIFWDTAGQERFMSVSSDRLKTADFILLVIRIDEEPLDVSSWIQLIENNSKKDIPIFLVRNACDEIPEVEYSDKIEKIKNELKIKSFFEISSKTGENFNNFRQDIVKFCQENAQSIIKSKCDRKTITLTTRFLENVVYYWNSITNYLLCRRNKK